ncbi:hypothetical protein KKD19_02235 [Patescibacteria group bacterium]|nr:hypothetical protein [Patescibacteria group bacterium]MCG2693264.1 hypothetical protein [Candidatus Parcubacteria bacterium]
MATYGKDYIDFDGLFDIDKMVRWDHIDSWHITKIVMRDGVEVEPTIIVSDRLLAFRQAEKGKMVFSFGGSTTICPAELFVSLKLFPEFRSSIIGGKFPVFSSGGD